MNDQWEHCGFTTVSAVYTESLRLQLERIIHRRFELDAWEMEGQVLRKNRMRRELHRGSEADGAAG